MDHRVISNKKKKKEKSSIKRRDGIGCLVRSQTAVTTTTKTWVIIYHINIPHIPQAN